MNHLLRIGDADIVTIPLRVGYRGVARAPYCRTMARMTEPLLAAAVVVACSCGSQQRAVGHGGVVPWVDRPAPTYTPPPWVAPPADPASAAPCRARQLQVTSSQFAAAAGSGVQRFAFTNVSSATCMLGGFPTVTGELASGKRRVLHIARPAGGTFTGKLVPADIPPGHHGGLDLAFSDACPTGRHVLASNVAFVLPEGGSVETRYRIWRTCRGLAMSQLGRRAPEPLPPHRRPGTPDTLRVDLSLRNMTRIRSGSTLRYVVTLSNPRGTPVHLDPCPSYTEGIAAAPEKRRDASIERSFLLNCESIHAVGPHRQIRYAMELTIRPAFTTMAKVYWHLNTPNEPAAVAVVVIDPPSRGGTG